MWALLVAFGLVGGLVRVAWAETAEPTLRPAWRRAKLVRLARIPERLLKLDQAEDGLVLSREFNAPILAEKFRTAATRIKQKNQGSSRKRS